MQARSSSVIYPVWLPQEATNFISDPFFFFPTFYFMKEVLDSKSSRSLLRQSLTGGIHLDSARAALSKWGTSRSVAQICQVPPEHV